MTRPATVERTRSRARRILLTLTTIPLLLVSQATVALALATDKVAPAASRAPQSLAWITVQDSHGVPLWSYELNIDDGGINSPDLFVYAPPAHYAWIAYQDGCAIGIWLIEQAISFGWFKLIATPAMAVGESLHTVMAQLDVRAAMLMLAGAVFGWFLMRGRYMSALYEMFAAAIIAALAIGVLANPVALVAGPNGLVMKAREAALAIAVAQPKNVLDARDASQSNHTRPTGPQGDTAQERGDNASKAMVNQLVDTFVRGPHQYINFGRALDGTKCENAYTQALKEGPYGKDNDGLRAKVGACDPAAKSYADAPGPGMVVDAMSVMPSGGAILGFGVVVAAILLVACLYACYRAVMAVIETPFGIIPGGRAALASSVAQIIQETVMVFFILVFLAIYLVFIQTAMTSADGEPIMKRFWLVDLMSFAGIVVAIRERRRIKAMGKRLRSWLLTRPDGSRIRESEHESGRGLSTLAKLGQARNLLPSRKQGRVSRSAREEGSRVPGEGQEASREVVPVGGGAGEAGSGGSSRGTRPSWPGVSDPRIVDGELMDPEPDPGRAPLPATSTIDGVLVHSEIESGQRPAIGAGPSGRDEGPGGPQAGGPTGGGLRERLEAGKARNALPSPAAAGAVARLAVAAATGGAAGVALEGAKQAAAHAAGTVVAKSAQRRELEQRLAGSSHGQSAREGGGESARVPGQVSAHPPTAPAPGAARERGQDRGSGARSAAAGQGEGRQPSVAPGPGRSGDGSEPAARAVAAPTRGPASTSRASSANTSGSGSRSATSSAPAKAAKSAPGPADGSRVPVGDSARQSAERREEARRRLAQALSQTRGQGS